MVLLPFMTIEYALILEICLKLIQKYVMVLLNIQIFLIYKKDKALKSTGVIGGWVESLDPNENGIWKFPGWEQTERIDMKKVIKIIQIQMNWNKNKKTFWRRITWQKSGKSDKL